MRRRYSSHLRLTADLMMNFIYNLNKSIFLNMKRQQEHCYWRPTGFFRKHSVTIEQSSYGLSRYDVTKQKSSELTTSLIYIRTFGEVFALHRRVEDHNLKVAGLLESVAARSLLNAYYLSWQSRIQLSLSLGEQQRWQPWSLLGANK